MVKEFYASCGWQSAGADGERTSWTFDVTATQPPRSQFVALNWEA